MRELLNRDTLFNAIAMVAQEADHFVLVVEGADDHLLLRRYVSPDLNLIAATGGRSQALSAAQLAEERGVERVRFLVDRDYDDYLASGLKAWGNVIFSDHHDCFIDLMVADRNLLRRVIEVHSESSRRDSSRTAEVPAASTLEKEAVSLAVKLSAVRIVNARRGLDLNIRRFAFGNLRASEFDVRRIGSMILTRSNGSLSDHDELLDEVECKYVEISSLEQPPFGDHDLFSALARVLKKYQIHIKSYTLHQGFILATTFATVSRTGWFSRISEWLQGYGKVAFMEELSS